MDIKHTPYSKIINLPCTRSTGLVGTITFSVYQHKGSHFLNVSNSFSKYSLVGVPVTVFLDVKNGLYCYSDVNLYQSFMLCRGSGNEYIGSFEIEDEVVNITLEQKEVKSLVKHFEYCREVNKVCYKLYYKIKLRNVVKNIFYLPTKFLKL